MNDKIINKNLDINTSRKLKYIYKNDDFNS